MAQPAQEASTVYAFRWTCVVIYAATLVVGLWASYDTVAAVQRAALLAGGVALIPLIWGLTHLRISGVDRRSLLEDLIALFASVVACAVAVAWFALPGAVNDNVGAGVLAVLVPFTIAAMVRTFRLRDKARLVAHTILALPSIGALVLMGSRGAWAGLAAAALVVALLGVLDRRGRRPAVACAVTTALILLPIGVLVFALLLPDVAVILGRVSGTTVTRPALWADMLDQLSDVPFTGSGLAATMMTDATYVRLLHVGFIGHAHHLYVQVALEQGLPGLAAFMGIQAAALYLAVRAGEFPVVAALTVLLVHGAVDAGPYVARPAPLIFFPAAAAVLLAGAQPEPSLHRSFAEWKLLAFVPVVLLFLIPAIRASLQANLGAILQSRAELAHYSWPAVPIQDVLRRDPAIDLAPAIARFEAALALDPGNPTANRRLGQIELSRGDYVAAMAHLRAAFVIAPTHRATRQLLGELHAVAGDAGGARVLWRRLDLSQGQLDARRSWYDSIGDTARSAAINEVQDQLAHVN